MRAWCVVLPFPETFNVFYRGIVLFLVVSSLHGIRLKPRDSIRCLAFFVASHRCTWTEPTPCTRTRKSKISRNSIIVPKFLLKAGRGLLAFPGSMFGFFVLASWTLVQDVGVLGMQGFVRSSLLVL